MTGFYSMFCLCISLCDSNSQDTDEFQYILEHTIF